MEHGLLNQAVILTTEIGPSISQEADPLGKLQLGNPYLLSSVTLKPANPQSLPDLKLLFPHLTVTYQATPNIEGDTLEDPETVEYLKAIGPDGKEIAFLFVRSNDVLRAIQIEVD